MSIKQAIEALEVAQDALDISQSLQESAKSNHHPKTLAAYERVSADLAALRSMPAEPVGETLYRMKSNPDRRVLSAVIYEQFHDLPRGTKLYATPHTEAVRMSEAEIGNAIASHIIGESATYNQLQKFARAVEQATAARLGVKWGDV